MEHTEILENLNRLESYAVERGFIEPAATIHLETGSTWFYIFVHARLAEHEYKTLIASAATWELSDTTNIQEAFDFAMEAIEKVDNPAAIKRKKFHKKLAELTEESQEIEGADLEEMEGIRAMLRATLEKLSTNILTKEELE